MSEVQIVTGVVQKYFPKDGKKPYSVLIDGTYYTTYEYGRMKGVNDGVEVEIEYHQIIKGEYTNNWIDSLRVIKLPPQPGLVSSETEDEGNGEMEQTQALVQKPTTTPAVATQSPPVPFKDPYEGIATQSFSKEQRDILTAPIAPDDVSIKPTGEVYYDQMKYRIKLNGAFGAGAWGMRPLGKPVFEGGEITCGYDLIVMGGFVARAYGSQKWYPNNKRMTKADAVDSTKSDSLKKCCKDIGVATECWDKKFIREFKKTHCVLVEVKPPMNGLSEVWRRKDAPPFKDETGAVTKETQEPMDAEFENVSVNVETGNNPETTSPPLNDDLTPKQKLQKECYALLNDAFTAEKVLQGGFDSYQKRIEKGSMAQLNAVKKSLKEMVGEQ